VQEIEGEEHDPCGALWMAERRASKSENAILILNHDLAIDQTNDRLHLPG